MTEEVQQVVDEQFVVMEEVVCRWFQCFNVNALIVRSSGGRSRCTGCINKKQSPRKMMHFSDGSMDLSQTFRLSK